MDGWSRARLCDVANQILGMILFFSFRPGYSTCPWVRNGSSNRSRNHHRGAVADFLKATIHSGSQLSVVSAYFTIYAYDALRE